MMYLTAKKQEKVSQTNNSWSRFQNCQLSKIISVLQPYRKTIARESAYLLTTIKQQNKIFFSKRITDEEKQKIIFDKQCFYFLIKNIIVPPTVIVAMNIWMILRVRMWSNNFCCSIKFILFNKWFIFIFCS
jgi:hypothetical protein